MNERLCRLRTPALPKDGNCSDCLPEGKDCSSCIHMWQDDRSPEMCGSKEAVASMGMTDKIPYAADVNPNKDCQFHETKVDRVKGWLRLR